MLIQPPWYLRLYLVYRALIGRSRNHLPEWYFRSLMNHARLAVAPDSKGPEIAPLRPQVIPPPQWQCHCGATMSVKTTCYKCGSGMALSNYLPGDGRCKEIWFCRKCGNAEQPNAGLGPIYVCPVCESWKKVNYNPSPPVIPFQGNGMYHRAAPGCCTLPPDDPIHDEEILRLIDEGKFYV